MQLIRVGVDIAKSVFHVHGVDRHEHCQWKGRYRRERWLDALCERVPAGAQIGMEACGASHYWARELEKRGYHAKLIAAQFVKPFVKSNKNDALDAEAICEAMGRANMRYVAVKTVEQQDLQAAHRIREGKDMFLRLGDPPELPSAKRTVGRNIPHRQHIAYHSQRHDQPDAPSVGS